MKTQASFEIRAYIKGRINLNISQVHMCQIHGTSAASKTLVFRWRKKFQDGFTNHKDGSHPGQPKTIVTNVNIAALQYMGDVHLILALMRLNTIWL